MDFGGDMLWKKPPGLHLGPAAWPMQQRRQVSKTRASLGHGSAWRTVPQSKGGNTDIENPGGRAGGRTETRLPGSWWLVCPRDSNPRLDETLENI